MRKKKLERDSVVVMNVRVEDIVLGIKDVPMLKEILEKGLKTWIKSDIYCNNIFCVYNNNIIILHICNEVYQTLFMLGIFKSRIRSSILIQHRLLTTELRAKLDKVLKTNDVVLFMKGNREAPMVRKTFLFLHSVRIQQGGCPSDGAARLFCYSSFNPQASRPTRPWMSLRATRSATASKPTPNGQPSRSCMWRASLSAAATL